MHKYTVVFLRSVKIAISDFTSPLVDQSTSWCVGELSSRLSNHVYSKAYWTIRRQTNSQSVRLWTGQLANLVNSKQCCFNHGNIIIYLYIKQKPNTNPNPIDY